MLWTQQGRLEYLIMNSVWYTYLWVLSTLTAEITHNVFAQSFSANSKSHLLYSRQVHFISDCLILIYYTEVKVWQRRLSLAWATKIPSRSDPLSWQARIDLTPEYSKQPEGTWPAFLESLSHIIHASWITGLLKHVSNNMEIDVGLWSKSLRVIYEPLQIRQLAKAIPIIGQLGSEGLPSAAQAFKEGKEGQKFTVINNSGILALAKAAKWWLLELGCI